MTTPKKSSNDLDEIQAPILNVIFKSQSDDEIDNLPSLLDINMLPLMHETTNGLDYMSQDDVVESTFFAFILNFDIRSFDSWIRLLDKKENQLIFLKIRIGLSNSVKDLLTNTQSQAIINLKMKLLETEVELAWQMISRYQALSGLESTFNRANIHTRLSEGGKKGAIKRHLPSTQTKAFAIAEYQKKKYKSMFQGALDIEKSVCDFAKANGHPLSIQGAVNTIYRWIMSSEKYDV